MDEHILKLNERLNKKTLTQQEIDEITKSVADFIKGPNERADVVSAGDQQYKESVRIYFLLKEASALFEAESKTLPTQVFNEMRNALDHFMRSLVVANPKSKEGNIKQVENHIQRGFLDISKLICAYYDEATKGRHDRISEQVLGNITNGDYIKEFTRLQTTAHSKFTEAKVIDYKLGTDGQGNVREAYIDAVIAHRNLYKYQADNYGNLKFARARWFGMRSLTAIVLFVLGLTTDIIAEYVSRWWF
jgi:hypothetical protein